MANVVGAIFTSHAWVDTPPEEWDSIRASRHHRSDVPTETDSEKKAKSQRMEAAIGILRSKLDEMRPDVLVIFGDDQYEYFTFENFPALAVYAGEEFAGRLSQAARREPASAELQRIPGHPELATALLTGFIERGFDPAFCLSPPNSERGMCHAIMNPLSYLESFETPVVPVLLNAYYAPQMPARRCHQVGRAVREILDAYPADMRVAVIGSGGLWHTPFRDSAYLDEDFDRQGLGYLRAGNITGWAEFFDNYKVPDGDESQYIGSGRGATGLPSPGGPQIGTRETCNWIGAAGVVDGSPAVVVDYVPVYASPIGAAFAYCEDV